jgi:hypothetical protein
VTPGVPANEDGLYSGGVTFTATANAGKDFLFWTVNGERQPDQPMLNQLALTINGHKTVRGVFAATWTVTANSNDGNGSLRDILNKVSNRDRILFPAGQTITLTEPLPGITTSLSIEGNGATLTQRGFAETETSQLLRINSADAEVYISRLHFKGGRAAGYGGAIRNSGKLTLESCVFSDNRTSNPGACGGAIYTAGTTSIYGCTFAGNNAAALSGGSGGAVYTADGTLTLTGNLFWENTAGSHSVVNGAVSGGYNVSDKSSGTGAAESGWDFTTGDAQAAGLPLHALSFKPLAAGAAYQAVAVKPAVYPALDFNGAEIPGSNAMAGAVQAVIASTGFVLDYTATGPGDVTAIGNANSDGLYTGEATLTAVADPAFDGIFVHWTVDGTVQPLQTPPNVLTINVDAHKTVRGVFAKVWTVVDGGGLSEAVAGASAGDYIRMQTPAITLVDPLTITKSLFIEGNGAILTGGFTASAASQLLFIAATADVHISRLHFRGGRANNYGAAIQNAGGKLTLESCIFSDNQTSASNAFGGAIYSSGSTAEVKIYGSTFAGNVAGTSGGMGGAVYKADGALTLTGNLFWENRANTYSVVYGTTSVTSGGYNIADKPIATGAANSGWDSAAGDAQGAILPLRVSDFRPLSTGAAYQAIGTRPGVYPIVDFNGAEIPGSDAMAGAVQSALVSDGYMLDYGNVGPGSVTVAETPDTYGFYSGSVTLTAAADTTDGGTFKHWTVDGIEQADQTPPNVLILPMNGHKAVRGVFAKAWTVSDEASLRSALTGSLAGDSILFPAGGTITLVAPLEAITKSLVIEGRGATLTRSYAASATSQLLRIDSTTADVRISRLHFKGGRATINGAGIQNAQGKLSLESCIFSDNQTSISNASGGAIFTGGNTSISGCTFVGNVAGTTTGRGGAIYKSAGTLTLTGNLFWENSANTYSLAYQAGSAISSGGYNVSDKDSGATNSGWTFATGDAQGTGLPLRVSDFKPLSTGAAYRAITTKPGIYPTVDFNGDIIPQTNAMAGAVQNAIVSDGYMLDHGTMGPGTVTVTETPDSYGFYSGSVTLTAAADTANGGTFKYWTVDGIEQAAQVTPNVLILPMNGHKTVRGVFAKAWTVSDETSLRSALTGSLAGDSILFPAGGTITLAAPLEAITKSLVIEGRGATLTRSFAASADSQLLYINSTTAEVRISRLHFKGGRANDYGAAIRNTGTLTLESCIFSDNQTSNSNASGGAIFTGGNTSISGCTFVGNVAGTTTGRGGAIYKSAGTLTLTGNLFWGNTANTYSVAYQTGPAISSGGYNIADKPIATGATNSGWDLAAGDAQGTILPLRVSDFRPLSTGAAYQAIGTRPGVYPTVDFNGAAIPGSAAMAGAVQNAIVSTGFVLDHAPIGQGTITVTGGTVADDLYSGDVTLTANPTGGSTFMHWTVNGTVQPDQTPLPNVLNLTMNGHKTVRAIFATAWPVTDAATLATALTSALDGDYIRFPAGGTITLTGILPQITKSLIIEGNGATLTQSHSTVNTTSQLLYINSTTVDVRISRLHFKGGRATDNGAAINNKGKLTLESCIFSDNQTTNSAGYGGALYSSGSTADVKIYGCTFAGNVAGTTSGNGRGGAVYRNSGTLTLTGNLFWGNTANSYSVAYGAASGGYNVSDKDSGAANSGWTFTTGDAQALYQPLNLSNFRPLSSGEAYRIIGARPEGYPTVDFNGDPIPGSNAMAGAVQNAIVSTGFVLDYAATGQGTVTPSGGTETDGLYSGSVTLTATSTGGSTFMHWTVNGTEQPAQSTPNVLILNMDGHKTVCAIFATAKSVTSSANDGAGSLRQAVSSAAVGDYIVFQQGLIVTLTASLTINKSLTIIGNGATLTQTGFTPGTASQLLRISGSSTNVRISRLHFKGGRATDNGAAINNSSATLTLESCIFSDNITTFSGSYAYGGAICTSGSSGSLTVLGCTFTGNQALTTGNGAAIYRLAGTLSLTGNIFAGNTATDFSVVHFAGSGAATNGYNVSDKNTGTTAALSGWNFHTNDVMLTDVTFDGDFKPSSAGLPVIPSLPEGFPATYFNGDPRGSNSTPGAMPKN